jgi:RNA polymerase sigma factor (sigma-70 family)
MSDHTSTTSNFAGARFPTVTHWTVVLDSTNPEALEELCRLYWPPLYAFLRKTGQPPEEAKDLTQGFFAHLLRKEGLQSVHPAKGKFRSFLLASLKNYIRNERARGRAEKRGSGRELISIQVSEAEERYRPEPSDKEDPSSIFERRWASTLIEHALAQLRLSYAAKNKADFCDLLVPFLTGDAARGGYAEAAAKLSMSEGAIRTAASRLREEFGLLLRAEVKRIVESEAEVDSELRYLLSLFQSR